SCSAPASTVLSHLSLHGALPICCCDNYPNGFAEENTMDYEFLRDITGVVKVRMSMGHEAVGHWFNEEVKENLALLDEVEQAANRSEEHTSELQSREKLVCRLLLE